jgi:hypothetical protein
MQKKIAAIDFSQDKLFKHRFLRGCFSTSAVNFTATLCPASLMTNFFSHKDNGCCLLLPVYVTSLFSHSLEIFIPVFFSAPEVPVN